ncbi:MAG: serpin family protein [Lachnospiraceae bacterium]
MKRQKRKTAKRYMISMIGLLSGLIIVILIMESVTGWRIKDLTKGLTAKTINTVTDITEPETMSKVMDFSVKLLKSSAVKSENTLISPLSSLNALAMVAVGAEGDTRTQMEEAVGFSVEEWKEYVYLYQQGLPEAETGSLKQSNSIWLNEESELKIKQSFLQTITDYFGASAYQIPFDDKTRKEMNLRLSKETNGTIKEILPELSEEAVMYLVSTMSFICEWSKPYDEYQIHDKTFTTEQGTQRKVRMMTGKEFYYLRDEKAVGVMKYYDEGRYAFVALLPNEGIFMQEYISTLSGSGILQAMNQVEDRPIIMELPQFQLYTSEDLKSSLEIIGVTEGFDREQADFNGIATLNLGNLYIEDIVQKTYIDVNEHGTSAGAATVIAVSATAAIEEEPVYITFDRPFVYMILDRKTNMPIMMGTVMDIGS